MHNNTDIAGMFAPRENLWAELNRSEICQARDAGALVVIPAGATEQHGEHLPTGTDTFLSTSVAQLAAARVCNPRVLVTPPVAVGFSPHHLSWPGTLSMRLDTYLSVLRDIAKSVIDTGFERAIFVNGHGGNSAPLRALCAELVTDGYAVGMVDYFAPGYQIWSSQLKGSLSKAGHACEYETALTLALTDEETQNRIGKACSDFPARLTQPWVASGDRDPITDYGAGWPPIFQDGDCGYWGDPAASNVETGKIVLEATVSKLAEFLTEFSTADLRVGR
jgi:creatinine amidohydrolase